MRRFSQHARAEAEIAAQFGLGFRLFSELPSIGDFDSEVTYRGLYPCVPMLQLHGSQALGAPANHRSLGA